MGSEIESSKAAFSTNTYWAEWAAFAVFVGLIADIVVIVAFDLRDKDKSLWEIGLAGAGALVIAAGVWGESHFGNRATNASSQIQAVLGKETAETNARAAEANQKKEQLKLAARKFRK